MCSLQEQCGKQINSKQFTASRHTVLIYNDTMRHSTDEM